MGSLYLTWMADAFEQAGLTVVRYSGWTTRARSTGGFESGRPLAVMWHHTASSASPDSDAYYMCYSSSDKPICNVMVDRTGTVWCLAAGATNTNGKGNSIAFSHGTVPKDSMNQYAVGMEICNNGVGEPYPQAQIDAAFVVSNTLTADCGIMPFDVCTHQAYAPDRKIDPARAEAVQGPWRPRSINSSGTWDLGDLADECNRRASGPIPPPTPEDDDDMIFDGFWRRDNGPAVFAIYKNGTKVWVQNDGDLNAYKNLMALNGATAEQQSVRVQPDPCMFTAFGVIIGPRPPGVDEYGNIP